MQAPNAQGIAGLMSQGRAPQAPQQAQQPSPSPMKASPMASIGSVEDRVAAYRGNPAPLQQRYAMSQDLLDLLALQQIKSEKENAARQMQMQMAQQQAAQGAGEMTVAQQREKEVMELTKNELAQQRGETAQQQVGEQQANLQKVMSGGLPRAPGAQTAAQPKMMAAGGIVAFSGTQGSEVNLSPAQVRQKLAEAVRNNDIEGAKFYRQWLETNVMPTPPAQAPRVAVPSGLREPVRVAPPRAEPAAAPETPRAPAMSPADMRQLLQTEGDAAVSGIGGPRPTAPAAPRPAAPRPAAPAAAPGTGAPVQAAPLSETITAAPGITYQKPTMDAVPALNRPTMDTVTAVPGLKESIQTDLSRDPLAMQREQEDRIRAAYALTPEQRRVYEEGITQRRQMFDEAYNPDRMRREGIKQFLLGGGGRRYGEFGGGARAARAYDEGARAQRRKDFEDLQKSREGLIGLERAGIAPSIEGGLKGLEAGSNLRRTGQASGANVLGTESQAATSKFATEGSLAGQEYTANKSAASSKFSSDTSAANTQYTAQMQAQTADRDRKVTEMKNKLQAEANRIGREGVDVNRAQTILSTTMGKLRDLLQDMDDKFNKRPDIGLLLAKDPKSLTPEEKNRLEIARGEHEQAKRRLRQEVAAELRPIQSKLGMGSATEGWGELGEKKK